MKRGGRIQAIVLVLFFLSGATGLVYEVVWQRMLGLVFGNTTFATAPILVSFMCGLALGSFYFGRLVDRYREPLKLYAYLEAGIAVFALLAPFIISGVTAVYAGIYEHVHTTFYLFSLLKFILCFLVLLIPSFLMGGTLPVISKFFVERFETLSWRVGILYGSNTLGGVIGAFTAGFLLINWLGVSGTTYAAAVVNILIAGAALGLSKFLVSDGSVEPRPRERETVGTGQQVYPKYISTVVLIVYALSGVCALAYEVLWTRVLVFFLGNSTYAFTIMLTTFLLGLALGSLIFARFLDKRKHLLVFLAFIEVFIGLSALLSIWQVTKLDDILPATHSTLGGSWYATIATNYVGSFLIMLIPTVLMGIAFPLAIKIFVSNLARLGHGIGNLYSANTLGAVVGSFAAGFVLIPAIGITKSIMLIAVANLVLGAVVLFFGLLARHRVKWGLAGVMVVLLVVMVATVTTPGITLQRLPLGQELLYYKEGSATTVAVARYGGGEKLLMVNGVGEVPTDYDSLLTFHMLGHLPLLLHEDPQKALIICFGAGIASGAVAEHSLQEIDAVEISPEVIEANKYFLEENQAVLDDPRLNLTIEDGRNYLLGTTNRYDVITSDATHPRSGDSWVLYTREFYELARERLNPDGIMTQWLPVHNLAPADYKTILKTFQTVFPDTTLWLTNRYTLLVGTKKELTIDFSLLAQRLQDDKINEDLEQFGLGDPIAFLSTFVMGKEAIAEFTLGVPINTDNRPVIQFAGRRFAEISRETGSASPILSELSRFSGSVVPLLTNMGESETEIKTTLENRSLARSHVIQATAYDHELDFTNAIYELEKALAIDPDDRNVQNSLEVAQGKELAQVERAYSYHVQGLGLLQAGRLDEAMGVFTSVLQFYPKSVEALYGLATIHFTRGEYVQAIEELTKAIDIDPGYPQARYSLARAYIKMEEYEDAEIQLKEVLRIAPDFEAARTALEDLKDTGR